MNGITAGFKRRKFWLRLWIIILAIFFLTPGPKPVLAIESEQARTIGFTAGGIFLASVAAYTIWLSRSDGKGDWAPRGPGGFYIGAYGGGSFVSDSNWNIKLRGPKGETTANANKVISVQPSGVVGAKLGYFFHRFPYLGMESEFSYASHQVRTQNVQFGNIGASFNDTLDNYSFVLRLLGRYGFLPDKEVPFGRLQPYVGLGIGLEILI
jgi:hypothetical protein